MEKKEAQKIIDTCVCKGCDGNLVMMLTRVPGSYRAEYTYRCVNRCDVTVGIKKLGGLLQRYAEGNLPQRDAIIIKESIGGMISMDETNLAKTGTAAERFTAIVLREFNGLTGTNLGLTDFQKKLAQHLFVKVDVALKSFEAKRKGTAVAPYTWANVNLDKLAVDAIYRIDLGLDALIPNHIHPVPYFNDRGQKYDLDLRIGYVGKDYIHRRLAVEPPVNVVYEPVYSTDKFRPIKNSDGSSRFEFEITQPFSRGEIVGGFGYVIYEDPRKNQLIIVSEDDFLKSAAHARDNTFWRDYPTEMRLKTLVHRVTEKIPLDPQKTNNSYRMVEKEEALIEGTYREVPSALEELPSFDAPLAVPPSPPKKDMGPSATQTAAPVPTTQTDDLANHRTSIVELAQKYLGSDAYEKLLCPFFLGKFEKQGISTLTLDELSITDKWLAEQIKLITEPKETKSKSKPKAADKTKTTEKPKTTTRTEPLPSAATQSDQVRAIVKDLMSNKKWTNDEVKKLLNDATGKKSGWTNDDAPAITKAVEAIEKKKAEDQLKPVEPTPTADEVANFLNEGDKA